jgi:hypothetical protein
VISDLCHQIAHPGHAERLGRLAPDAWNPFHLFIGFSAWLWTYGADRVLFVGFCEEKETDTVLNATPCRVENRFNDNVQGTFIGATANLSPIFHMAQIEWIHPLCSFIPWGFSPGSQAKGKARHMWTPGESTSAPSSLAS